jgi:hypothetical protein
MFVRAMGDYPPYRDGWCGEVPDRIGWPLVGRILEIVSPADVQAYELTMATIDRYIAARIGGTPRSAAAPSDPGGHPARGGRRVVTQDQWREKLGQDQPGYWQAAMAHRQVRS